MPIRITWKTGRELPSFVKGGALGLVDGTPVYACGMAHPWRETELSWWWDAADGQWQLVEPSIPLGRCYTQGVGLRDGLLVLGGRRSDTNGRRSLRDAWWLRREQDAFAWTRLPNMHFPRAIPSAGVSGNRVIAFGGGQWEKSQGGAFTTIHLHNYEILDLDDLESGWRDMGPLPFPSLVGSACATADESLYLFGGYACWTENGKRRIASSAAAWRYDFPTDQWTRLADCPAPASGWCAAAWGKAILLLGGSFSALLAGVSTPFRTYHILDAGTPRQRLIGAYSNLVFAYDIPTGSHRVLEGHMPIGLNDLRGTLSGNTLYAIGGETVDPALSNTINIVMIGEIEEEKKTG